MDAISDPRIHTVVVEKAGQVGWTEILLNAIGYYIHQDPSPLLIIQPTLDMAEAFSKRRLAPMLRDTPALRDLVEAPRSRESDNTLREKAFKGGGLAIIGANAPASLASRPIRVVLADEIDRYPLSAGGDTGKGEGDPLELARVRQLTFWNSKTLLGSTPKLMGTSVIDREFKLTDQRRYFVPCKECGEFQHLQWAQVKWDKAEDGTHLPHTAFYQCEHCGAIWSDLDRNISVSKGQWRATAEGKGGIAGFHIPGLVSPWLTLEKIVTKFLEARHDPTLLQPFVNTIFGEPWEDVVEKVSAQPLLARVETYTEDSIPAGPLLITAGCDVQSDRLEVQVVGWGEREESWVILYESLFGDPAQPKVWEELDELLKTRFHAGERDLRIAAACVDSGGHHAERVYAFCKTRRSRRIFAVKGVAGPRLIWPKRATRTQRSTSELFMIGVDTAKDAIYGRLKIQRPGPGFIHFPMECDEAYFDQLTSEVVETRKREGISYRVWVLPSGKRNEALDTFVYALAARRAIPVRLDKLPEPDGDAQQPAPQAEPALISASPPAPEGGRPAQQTWVDPRRQHSAFQPGGWMGQRRGWMDR